MTDQPARAQADRYHAAYTEQFGNPDPRPGAGLNRFKANLATIADCYALLAAQHHAAATGKPGARVAGTSEPRLPIAVDHVDLTAEARHGSLDIADTTAWPEDQIGHLPVATELDFWVRDIADLCGDKLPLPTAPVLAMWLHERAGWAWDYYGALDEMVVAVSRIARTLHAAVNPRGPKPEGRTAPCPGCEAPTLEGDGERVWCVDEECGRVLTEAEYAEWARAEAHRQLNGGQGISAKAIALRWNRPIGTVKRWAHQYGWTRSDGSERPVLYLAEQVEKTVALILKREAEERERREREAKAA